VRGRAYTAMLYLGCVAGVYAGAAVADAEGLSAARFAVATTILLVPAFAGARLWFVLQHPATFRSDPRRMWRRGDGGMSLYGGLVLGVVASIPVLAVADLPFRSFWDAAAVTMLVGLIVTRIGCVLNGCCAGRFSVPAPLLEAAWAAVVLAAAVAVRPHLAHAGTLFALVVAAYAAGRVVLEPARVERSRLNLAFSACLLPAALGLLVL
jgi:phosphatidylglycerol---prolipoprotein diacylglyceryl transferase